MIVEALDVVILQVDREVRGVVEFPCRSSTIGPTTDEDFGDDKIPHRSRDLDGKTVYLACSQLLNTPLRRDLICSSPQSRIVSIGAELHQHLTTTTELCRHSPEVIRTLLSSLDIALLEVHTLCRASILSRLPLGGRVIVAVRLIVEELDSPLGREGIRLERNLKRRVSHIPLHVIDRGTDH